MSDRPVTIRCDCGAELTGSRSMPRLTCECGAVYAVTVTRLKPVDGDDRSRGEDERATPQ